MTHMTPFRFTVEQYHQAAEIGVFGPEARVELLDGIAITIPTPSPAHASIVKRLNMMFSRWADRRALIAVHSPIRLGEYSEPRPDFALLHLRDDYYCSANPSPENAFLVAEVVETSEEYEGDEKDRAYALAGIPAYWILDVKRRRIEARTDPSPEGYLRMRILLPGDVVPIPGLPDLTVAIADLLGAS